MKIIHVHSNLADNFVDLTVTAGTNGIVCASGDFVVSGVAYRLEGDVVEAVDASGGDIYIDGVLAVDGDGVVHFFLAKNAKEPIRSILRGVGMKPLHIIVSGWVRRGQPLAEAELEVTHVVPTEQNG